MQSDGNNFSGYVVSDSLNKTSWDEENIFDQIRRSKYVSIIIIMILILYNIIWKVPCYYMLYFLKYAYSFLTFKILIIKIQKDYLFIFFVLNAVFITVYHVKLSKTTSPQKLFPSDCITLYINWRQEMVHELLAVLKEKTKPWPKEFISIMKTVWRNHTRTLSNDHFFTVCNS